MTAYSIRRDGGTWTMAGKQTENKPKKQRSGKDKKRKPKPQQQQTGRLVPKFLKDVKVK